MYRFRILCAAALCAAGAAGAAGESIRVRFVVVTPDCPADAAPAVFLAGSHAGWRPDALRLDALAPGIYAGSAELPAGPGVEYKFTRDGTWATVEKTAAGAERLNRHVRVAAIASETQPATVATAECAALTVVNIVECWADRAPQARVASDAPASQSAPPQRTSMRTGEIRVHENVAAPQLGNQRTVLVWLPPGYEQDAGRRYPVLYMHDGNNIFDAATSFAGVEWGADETADRLIRAGRLAPLIIVGVYNTPARMDEYTPWPDGRARAGGRAEAYLAFLADTLKPFIDRMYRTRPERAATAIGGSSLGGLVSLYALYERAETFGRAAVISPTLAWADGKMMDYARTHPWPDGARAYVSAGTAEGGAGDRYARDCEALLETLAGEGARRSEDVRLEIIPGGLHNEATWAADFERVLTWLFPAREQDD